MLRVDAYDKYTCHMKIICWFDQHVRFFSSDVIRSRATNRNSINHNALYTTIATTTTTTTRTTTTTTTTTITIMFDNETQTTISTIIGYYLRCCFWMKWFDLRSPVVFVCDDMTRTDTTINRFILYESTCFCFWLVDCWFFGWIEFCISFLFWIDETGRCRYVTGCCLLVLVRPRLRSWFCIFGSYRRVRSRASSIWSSGAVILQIGDRLLQLEGKYPLVQFLHLVIFSNYPSSLHVVCNAGLLSAFIVVVAYQVFLHHVGWSSFFPWCHAIWPVLHGMQCHLVNPNWHCDPCKGGPSWVWL